MHSLISNERLLTKTFFEMESRGILIDRDFVKRAAMFEFSVIEEGKQEFEKDTGHPFKDSSKLFAKIYDERGEPYPKTAKGNPSFTKDFFKVAETPTTKLIRKIKEAEKRVGTYYTSFLHYAGLDDRIHANIRQAGTTTGRLSYSNPNLQNVPKEENAKGEFVVRRSFIPPPDFYLVSLDYAQVEYRLMLDYAGEARVIKAVMDGEDLHQSMADVVGITRQQAKTLNFACLYGAGPEKIAWMLKISHKEAVDLRNRYFSKLPKVRQFIKRVMQTGEARGYVRNWCGRRCHIRFKSESYRLPNHLIQGGAADIIKFAMPQISDLLKGSRNGMVIQIHDDIVSEIHENDLHLVKEIKTIMEKVYEPKNGMYLSAEPEISKVSWAKRDLEKFVC